MSISKIIVSIGFEMFLLPVTTVLGVPLSHDWMYPALLLNSDIQIDSDTSQPLIQLCQLFALDHDNT